MLSADAEPAPAPGPAPAPAPAAPPSSESKTYVAPSRAARRSIRPSAAAGPLDDTKCELVLRRQSKRPSSMSRKASAVGSATVAISSKRKSSRFGTGKRLSKMVRGTEDDSVVYKRRLWNSTSSLFISTTMIKPDVTRSLRCLSAIVNDRINPTGPISIFDEPSADDVLYEEGDESDDGDEKERYDQYRKRPPAKPGLDDDLPKDKHAIYGYIMNVFVEAQLVNETIVMALVYMDRLQAATGISVTYRNVRPLLLSCFMLASKVWDDISMWNVDFAEIFPGFGLDNVNRWERSMLNLISFDVAVSSKVFAEYYFNLRSEEIKLNKGLEVKSELGPLDVEKAEQLEAISSDAAKSMKDSTSDKRGRAWTGSNVKPSHRLILS